MFKLFGNVLQMMGGSHGIVVIGGAQELEVVSSSPIVRNHMDSFF